MQGGGDYFIRSIYFDSPDLKALCEKELGMDRRRKYRVRLYNGNFENLYLECKIKTGTRIDKKKVRISKNELDELMKGQMSIRVESSRDVLGELQLLICNERFRPGIIVDYLREAYVYPLSNLRITFDKQLAAGKVENYLLEGRCMPNVMETRDMILEVKYDEYLPQHISDIIASIRPTQVAASKYVMCMTKKVGGKVL